MFGLGRWGLLTFGEGAGARAAHCTCRGVHSDHEHKKSTGYVLALGLTVGQLADSGFYALYYMFYMHALFKQLRCTANIAQRIARLPQHLMLQYLTQN